MIMPQQDESSTSSSTVNLVAEVLSSALLFLLIFGMSATVDVNNLKTQVRNKRAILTGILMQFVIMPILGFLAVMSLKDHGLTTAMSITLLMVTASPGGSYSNWWCSTFNADLALSIAMTALSTLLSVALLPANLMLYSHVVFASDDMHILESIDFKALFTSIAIVITAILLGLYTSYRINNPGFQNFANKVGSISGIALIVFSAIVSSSSSGEDAKPWGQHWSFYVGVSSPCVLGLLLANLIAKFLRLEKPEIVTISVECCYQNVGIATSAAIAMFDNPTDQAQAICVPLLYGLVEAGLLGLYCLVAWKMGWTKAPKDEKLHIILVKNYQCAENEDGNNDETRTSTDDHQEDKKNKVENQSKSTRNSWWTSLFRRSESRRSMASVEEQSDDRFEFDDSVEVLSSKHKHEDKCDDCGNRKRMMSADVTVATTASSGERSTRSRIWTDEWLHNGDEENSLNQNSPTNIDLEINTLPSLDSDDLEQGQITPQIRNFNRKRVDQNHDR